MKQILVLCLVFISPHLWGATCSCSSVPLLGSMSSASPADSSWFFSSSYEIHDISDLYSGSNEVNDETGRDRDSQSLLLEVSYGFNEKWSITGLLSAVEQNRKVGENDSTTGRGIGDGLVMLKYSPKKVDLFSCYVLSFGIGAKIPLGDDNKTGFVTLAEDLQPSTGAYSGVFWGQVSRSFDRSARSLLHAAVVTIASETKLVWQLGQVIKPIAAGDSAGT